VICGVSDGMAKANYVFLRAQPAKMTAASLVKP